MATERLKMKIGDYEIDAEGPEELVQARLDAFTELVKLVTALKTAEPEKPARTQDQDTSPRDPQNNDTEIDNDIGHIMQAENRVVSLTVPPESVADAALLILFGQKVMRDNNSVTGAEVIDGIRMSGQNVDRVDRLLQKAADAGEIISVGQKRGKRYRLTNRGVAKAREIAKRQINLVA